MDKDRHIDMELKDKTHAELSLMVSEQEYYITRLTSKLLAIDEGAYSWQKRFESSDKLIRQQRFCIVKLWKYVKKINRLYNLSIKELKRPRSKKRIKNIRKLKDKYYIYARKAMKYKKPKVDRFMEELEKMKDQIMTGHIINPKIIIRNVIDKYYKLGEI